MMRVCSGVIRISISIGRLDLSLSCSPTRIDGIRGYAISQNCFSTSHERQILFRTQYRSRYARRYRQSGSDRLEKQLTDLRQKTCYFGDRTLTDQSDVDSHRSYWQERAGGSCAV